MNINGHKQDSQNQVRSHMSEGGGSGHKQDSQIQIRSHVTEGGGSGHKHESKSDKVTCD